MIGLEREMTYSVKTTNALQPTTGSPRAVIQYWQVSEARLAGKRIRAELAATGIDWMRVGADGFWRPDVRAQFITDDGAVLLMHYTGLVEQTERFKAAAESDRPTEGTSNTCGFPLHSIPATRATAGLTEACLSPPAGCLVQDESNTPFTGSPDDVVMTLTASFILLATEAACPSRLANPLSFTHNRPDKGTN